MMKLLSIACLLAVIGQGEVHAFTTTRSSGATTLVTSKRDGRTTSGTVLRLSDVPEDKEKSNLQQQQGGQEVHWFENNQLLNKKDWKDDLLPEPPEDQLTMAGDIASLFLYAFVDHFVNDVMLSSILASSTSAADAAHSLDPSGEKIALASTAVWVDSNALGPAVSDHLLFMDLQQRVTPHFSHVLDSAGTASVTLASCWLVAGLFHKAFHFRNTLDCSTERAVAVTGQTWVTASMLMLLVATTSQHLMGTIDVQDMSTGVLVTEGRILSPIEEWFSVLSKNDAEYIFNSLGVVLTWRFMISFLLGGWRK